ncbi:hypothetical protein [Mucilaginibacter pocheonensis]|uniref:Uncharacterized protein n=1 Tax=Mucilaginibacter pocheonensis TaxID=398050 RepID=A0ABU1T9A1_9SPHI|nr:hypothetical protein [Mucilaginibacter pocheonensis]MDR6941893.1 hypothetical protein [Mucilaginibacter pocheonensis]
MKALIKYISLLLFSGLIIPFYNHHYTSHSCSFKSEQLKTASCDPSKVQHPGFLFINDVVKNIFPVLKNLN